MVREFRNESDRLESLYSYGVLDTPAHRSFDGITELAAMILDTPVAIVTLVDDDRQWFKSRFGIDETETPRSWSFCTYCFDDGEPLVVPDATKDPRFAENPVVAGPHHIRAYAGVPLIGRDGLPLGALCVLDRRPREFSAAQINALGTLAAQVMTLMEIGRLDTNMGRQTGPDELGDPVRLRAALDHGEFHPYFQPVVNLDHGDLRGFEALLRWEHPQHGLLLPGRFLPAIESSGLIMPVGRHVLRESIRLLADLRGRRSGARLGVAVNLSFSQLAQPGIATTVIAELAGQHVSPAMLSLELTESAALHNDRVAGRELQELHEAGVSLTIDDYGTGYSSLMRVLDLPIGTIKLDRSLIKRLPGDKRALAVVKSTLDMTQDLGIAVIAEGIELQEQRETLLALGCRYGQGFLFGHAVSRVATMALFRHEPRPAFTLVTESAGKASDAESHLV